MICLRADQDLDAGMLMLLRGGFGDYVLDWMQNQNILKCRQEGSAALLLGSHLLAKLSHSHKSGGLPWALSLTRPTDHKARGWGADLAPELCSRLALVLSPGVPARNKWAGSLSGLCRDPCLGPSSLPCCGAASWCQLDFGLSKAFWSCGCSFAFLRILQFFYFITQHPASPIPLYPCQTN